MRDDRQQCDGAPFDVRGSRVRDRPQDRPRHSGTGEVMTWHSKSATERQIATLKARVEEAERKQAIDQAQCDEMTGEAGRLAVALKEAESRAQRAEALLAAVTETMDGLNRVLGCIPAR